MKLPEDKFFLTYLAVCGIVLLMYGWYLKRSDTIAVNNSTNLIAMMSDVRERAASDESSGG